MATTITNTSELQIQLLSADGANQRVIRLSNPREDVTREEIVTALAPAITADQPFFYDDNDRAVALTVLGTTEVVQVQKTVRELLP